MNSLLNVATSHPLSTEEEWNKFVDVKIIFKYFDKYS